MSVPSSAIAGAQGGADVVQPDHRGASISHVISRPGQALFCSPGRPPLMSRPGTKPTLTGRLRNIRFQGQSRQGQGGVSANPVAAPKITETVQVVAKLNFLRMVPLRRCSRGRYPGLPAPFGIKLRRVDAIDRHTLSRLFICLLSGWHFIPSEGSSKCIWIRARADEIQSPC